MKIKFSHLYDKLLDSTGAAIKTALLLDVIPINLEDRSTEFLKYDTEGKYPLPKKGNYLMLIFQKGEKPASNIFTTLRRETSQKFEYYCKAIGEWFEVEINIEAKNAQAS